MKFAKFSLMVVAVAGLALFAWADDPVLVSDTPAGGPAGPGPRATDLATEQLFQGDLVGEMGLGCSNGAGTSGGPNDLAVGVTATLLPPFGMTSFTYQLFTQISPNITTLTFSVWSGTSFPGATVASQPLTAAFFPTVTNLSPQTFTAPVAPPVVMSAQTFFFGLTQPQSNVGMRAGLDTSSTAVTSYIRAPSCGAATFNLVDNLGFPGNWVMAVIIDDTIPVELMSFEID